MIGRVPGAAQHEVIATQNRDHGSFLLSSWRYQPGSRIGVTAPRYALRAAKRPGHETTHDCAQSRPGRCLRRQAQSGAARRAGLRRRRGPGARARRGAGARRGRRRQRPVLAGAARRRPGRVGTVAAGRGGEHDSAVRRPARGVGEGRRAQSGARGRDPARRRAEGMPGGDRGRRLCARTRRCAHYARRRGTPPCSPATPTATRICRG